MVSIPSPLAPSIKTLIFEALQLINLPLSGAAIPLWPWVLWSFWKARNKRCFEDRTYSATEIVYKAVSDAREWQDSQIHFAEDISLAHNHLAPHPSLRVNTSGPTCHVDATWDARSGMCGLGVSSLALPP